DLSILHKVDLAVAGIVKTQLVIISKQFTYQQSSIITAYNGISFEFVYADTTIVIVEVYVIGYRGFHAIIDLHVYILVTTKDVAPPGGIFLFKPGDSFHM